MLRDSPDIRFISELTHFTMAMVKNLYQISEGSNDLRDEIHRTVKLKKRKVGVGEISAWVDKTLQMQADLAKKVDELVERLVRLEDEIRKGGRPEMLRRRK